MLGKMLGNDPAPGVNQSKGSLKVLPSLDLLLFFNEFVFRFGKIGEYQGEWRQIGTRTEVELLDCCLFRPCKLVEMSQEIINRVIEQGQLCAKLFRAGIEDERSL